MSRISLRTTVLLCAVSLVVGMTAACCTEQPAVRADSPQAVTQSRYTLRAENGIICVYEQGQPVRPTDIHTDALPAADRAALADGIGADSEEEVNRRLEDFGS